MTFQVDGFLREVCLYEDTEMTERIGFVKGLDLITLIDGLRKHGVER